MSANSVQDGIETGVCVPQRVSISRWVNEPYPAWIVFSPLMMSLASSGDRHGWFAA